MGQLAAGPLINTVILPTANVDLDAMLKTFSNLKIFSTETVVTCNSSCREGSIKCNILGLDIFLGKLHKQRNSPISPKRGPILELRRQAYSRKDLFSFSLFSFFVWYCSKLLKNMGPPSIHTLKGLFLSWDENNCLITGSGMFNKPHYSLLGAETSAERMIWENHYYRSWGLRGKENIFEIFP